MASILGGYFLLFRFPSSFGEIFVLFDSGPDPANATLETFGNFRKGIGNTHGQFARSGLMSSGSKVKAFGNADHYNIYLRPPLRSSVAEPEP
jgi:hypothetical protein